MICCPCEPQEAKRERLYAAATTIRQVADKVRNGQPLYESTRNASRRVQPATQRFRREWFAAIDTFNQAQASAARLSGEARRRRLQGAAANLAEQWRAVIRRGFESAFRLGYSSRGRAGSRLTTMQINSIDSGFEAFVQNQARFATQFAQQYASGALKAPGRMGVGPRSNLYAQALKGAYNAGAVAGGPEGERIQWKLGACDHCPDCPLLAASGPYTRNTLPTYPGAGQTKCATNCCCHLVFIGGRTGERLAPAGAVDNFVEPTFTPVAGMATPTTTDIAFLRDLELRRNYKRREAAALDGQEKNAVLAELRQIQTEMNSYRRDRGIRWTPRFSVADVITKADINLKDIDDIFLRGIDGFTVYKADLSLIDRLIRESNEALLQAARRLGIPPQSPAVPSASTILSIKTAAADDDTDIGDMLPVDEQHRGRESKRALHEQENPPPVQTAWTINLMAQGIIAQLQLQLEIIRELKENGPYFVQVGPIDGDWPMITSVAGSWIRGDQSEVRRLRDALSDRGLKFFSAPLVASI